jgi:hypothetical protein
LATHMRRKNRKRLLCYTHWDCYCEIWIWNNKIRGVDILSFFQRTISSPFSARNICLILKYFKLDHNLQSTGEDSLRRQTKLRLYETKRAVMKSLMPARIFDSNSGCVLRFFLPKACDAWEVFLLSAALSTFVDRFRLQKN